MMIAIPPQYAVSQVMGFIKGTSAVHLVRVYMERKEFSRAALLGARVLLSTVGRDEAVIRGYIRNQVHEDERLDQMGLWR